MYVGRKGIRSEPEQTKAVCIKKKVRNDIQATRREDVQELRISKDFNDPVESDELSKEVHDHADTRAQIVLHISQASP